MAEHKWKELVRGRTQMEGVGTWQNINEKELVRGRIQTRRSWYVAEHKWKELVCGRI